ncbi:biopolymer transporter ExbD, partial [bacterium]|nr:biopolymer transporter ExbD [bacterium]
MARQRRAPLPGIAEANIVPLADVVTTLIVVFLLTMPALMWSGIQVNATRAAKSESVVRRENSAEDKLTVLVTAASIQVDGRHVDLPELGRLARERLAASADRTVIVVPEADVRLGNVVTVMDVLKQNGAKGLALLG